jgi:hypothetical protein
MDDLKQIFIKRLEDKGIRLSIIPCFVRDLANSFMTDPNLNYSQVNKRLHYLGWDDVDLDYHTLELALACFEIEGLKLSDYSPLKCFNLFVTGKSDAGDRISSPKDITHLSYSGDSG